MERGVKRRLDAVVALLGVIASLLAVLVVKFALGTLLGVLIAVGVVGIVGYGAAIEEGLVEGP